MPRGDNLTDEDRAKGGHHSHNKGNSKSGMKGGRSSDTSGKGLASADQDTREQVAKEGGES